MVVGFITNLPRQLMRLLPLKLWVRILLSYLRQVRCFLRFPPPMKLTTMI